MSLACKIEDLSFSLRRRGSFLELPVLAVLGVLMPTGWVAPCLSNQSIQPHFAENPIQNRGVEKGQSEEHLESWMMPSHLQRLWPSKNH